MQGYNGTVLAYGQTGTGKTHTLLNVGEQRDDAGLVPRLVAALFVAVKCDVKHVYSVKASFAQIYNEQIDDLLRPKHFNLRVKAKGTGHEVEGLSSIECKSPSDLLALFDQGRRALVYAETKMNKHSSRSHAVLQLTVSRRERVLSEASTTQVGSKSFVTTLTSGKLTIVDLAGSERVKRSGANETPRGDRMKEAININSSLLGLSNVMKALSTQQQHVPYRDSKLTHMLSDALGGNCRTSLVVCASPAAADVSETTAALEFGSRAMKVATHAVVNASDVTLDAAALAADLTEALQLQAEGAVGGQLLAMEAELRERQRALAELEEAAHADAQRRDGELGAALASASLVRREAAAAGEEVTELRRLLEVAEARVRELEGALADETTDRRELEAALAVKARDLGAAEKAAEEAAEEAAAAKRDAEKARRDAERSKRDADAARREGEGAQREAASALAAAKRSAASDLAAFRREAAAELAAAKSAAAAEKDALKEELAGFRRDAAAALAGHNKEHAEERAAAAAEAEAAQRREAAAATAAHAELSARLAEAEATAATERADARRAIDGLQAQLGAALEALPELETAAKESEATLRHRLKAATGALVEREGELASAASELSTARAQLGDVNGQLSGVQSELNAARAELGAASDAAGERAALHDAEVTGMRLQVDAALEAQAVAVDTVEAAVTPLQELVEGLHARLASEQTEAATKIKALKEAFTSLRDEYEKTLSELQSGQQERAGLAARCEQVEGLLAEEAARQDALAAALTAELAAREAELTAALDESSDKSRVLQEAATEAAAAAATTSALQAEFDAAEAALSEVTTRLGDSQTELEAASAERARLLAELETLGSIAREELAELEAERLAEVTTLYERAQGVEARLEAECAALEAEKAQRSASLQEADRRLTDAQESGSRQKQELWARIKRQAVLQAAAVRQLQESLSASRAAQQQTLESAGHQAKSARDLLAEKESEIEGMRAALRSAEAAHAKRLAASGVTALKHGRKGKPHPRHVRCTATRLEWGRPDERGRGYEKGIGLLEIERIEGGLATEVARRSGRGREETFLCVTSAARSLDLEFPSRAARDEWWATLSKWQEVLTLGLRGASHHGVASHHAPKLAAIDVASANAVGSNYTAWTSSDAPPSVPPSASTTPTATPTATPQRVPAQISPSLGGAAGVGQPRLRHSPNPTEAPA